MKKDIANMDDLFDDSIDQSLRCLGFTFPRTVSDFCQIESKVRNSKIKQPDRLKDPFVFLGKRMHNGNNQVMPDREQNEYSQNLAQAAREGKVISEEIKKRMAADKQKTNQKKNGQ